MKRIILLIAVLMGLIATGRSWGESKKQTGNSMTEQEKKVKMSENYTKATKYYQDGSYESAISEWEEVLKLDPTHNASIEKIKLAKEKLGEKPTIKKEEKTKPSRVRGYPMWLKKKVAVKPTKKMLFKK